jgi:hypothetical protein
MRTLVDPFEIAPVAPIAPRSAYRSKQQTLIDPYELEGPAVADTPSLEDWESDKRFECRVVMEERPRGISHESWRRARWWCDR